MQTHFSPSLLQSLMLASSPQEASKVPAWFQAQFQTRPMWPSRDCSSTSFMADKWFKEVRFCSPLRLQVLGKGRLNSHTNYNSTNIIPLAVKIKPGQINLNDKFCKIRRLKLFSLTNFRLRTNFKKYFWVVICLLKVCRGTDFKSCLLFKSQISMTI